MNRGKHKGERGEERMIVALGIFLCICSADGGFKGGCNVTLGGKEGERGMWGGGRSSRDTIYGQQREVCLEKKGVSRRKSDRKGGHLLPRMCETFLQSILGSEGGEEEEGGGGSCVHSIGPQYPSTAHTHTQPAATTTTAATASTASSSSSSRGQEESSDAGAAPSSRVVAGVL